MTGLVLVAASGLAREVLAMERARGVHERFAVLDDDPQLWGARLAGAPVLGGLEEIKGLHHHQVVVCAGKGAARRSLVRRLADLGIEEDRFATLVHPLADVPSGSQVGVGSIVLAQTVLTADVLVGRHVVLMPHVTLTHDVVVADHATLCAGVSLGGGVRVGDSAYVGMNACVREGLSVGPRSTLGMGSVLLQDLPAHETWVGVPARHLQHRASEETA